MSEHGIVHELRAPLRDHMRPVLTEAAVQQIWRTLQQKGPPARKRRSGVVTAGLAFVAAMVAAIFLRLVPGPGAPDARPGAGPLALAGGGQIPLLEASAPAPQPLPIALSDGSAITLSPGARLSVLENTGLAFSTLLSAGHVEFHVKKGGPRRWSIECGIATVEVLGTRFLIERTAARVRVTVFEGVVLVRGERVPDRVRRLVSGESLSIDDRRAEAESNPAVGAALPDSPPATRPEAIAPRAAKRTGAGRAAQAPAASWPELAKGGDYRAAYAALGAEGFRRESAKAGVETLLSLADIARLSGHPAQAAIPLSRIVRDHPGDPRAALSAFTLGRLQLDVLGQPAQAVASFKAALGLGLRAPLVEDAHARIVEALARGGDRDGARAAAADYERQFPNGQRLHDIRRWVAEE